MGIFDKSKSPLSENLDLCVRSKEEDWGLIIATCDLVNSSDSGAKEAAKFIRKKLKASNGNPEIQLRCITVMGALTENCGAKFHAEISSKKFLDDLEFVILSITTDSSVKQSLFTLFANWAEVFAAEPSLYPIANRYNKLKEITNLGQSLPNPVPQVKFSRVAITEDIELAKNNAQLLTQTLSFTDPEKEDIKENELIQEFYGKCKTLQSSIIGYLGDVQEDDWLNSLITVNQELLSAFKMYDDMVERGQVGLAKNQSTKNVRHDVDGYFGDEQENQAGVGSSGTSSFDPFADDNEVQYNPMTAGPSAKALGKLRASNPDDDASTSATTQIPPDNYSSTATSFAYDQLDYKPDTEYYQANGDDMSGRRDHIVI